MWRINGVNQILLFLTFYILQRLVVGVAVAFKSAKLAESVFAGQSVALTHQEVATESLSSDEADFEDLKRNADLCIFNQDDHRQD